MDDEPSNRQKRHRKRQAWEFTFFGGTSEKLDARENRAKFAPELAQSELEDEASISLVKYSGWRCLRLASQSRCNHPNFERERYDLSPEKEGFNYRLGGSSC